MKCKYSDLDNFDCKVMTDNTNLKFKMRQLRDDNKNLKQKLDSVLSEVEYNKRPPAVFTASAKSIEKYANKCDKLQARLKVVEGRASTKNIKETLDIFIGALFWTEGIAESISLNILLKEDK